MKVLIDNFGMDVDTVPVDEEHFQAKVMVCTSPTFQRWFFGFGGAMKLIGLKTVVDSYREMLTIALETINNGKDV